tara:strand:+ start:299 stop:541 length:243 start_codon:yes stop_codon:yes gene_type:complete
MFIDTEWFLGASYFRLYSGDLQRYIFVKGGLGLRFSDILLWFKYHEVDGVYVEKDGDDTMYIGFGACGKKEETPLQMGIL